MGLTIISMLMVLAALFNCQQGFSIQVQTCKLPKEIGPCRASHTRYYHNILTGNCEKFNYGGCRGNANNFDSYMSCKRECEGSVNVCALKAETGPCRASKMKFYYNKRSKKCEQFRYGGCQGNRNNFRTKNGCEAKCVRPIPTHFVQPFFCRKRVKTGTCRGAMTHYFFDKRTKTCKTFIYTGCRGNRNRFKTYAKCMKMCFPPPY